MCNCSIHAKRYFCNCSVISDSEQVFFQVNQDGFAKSQSIPMSSVLVLVNLKKRFSVTTGTHANVENEPFTSVSRSSIRLSREFQELMQSCHA